MKKMLRISGLTLVLWILASCGGSDKQTIIEPPPPPPVKQFATTTITAPFPGPDHHYGLDLIPLTDSSYLIVELHGKFQNGRGGGVSIYRLGEETPMQSYFGNSRNIHLGWLDYWPDRNRYFFPTVMALRNGNGLVVSTNSDESIILFDGDNGEQIGDTISGQQSLEQLGLLTISLANGNVVVSSPERINADASQGTTFLIDGTTGQQLGQAVIGTTFGFVEINPWIGARYDFYNGIGYQDILPLPSGNYLVTVQIPDDTGEKLIDSMQLVNGETGEFIGDALYSAQADTWRGLRKYALPNNNVLALHDNDPETYQSDDYSLMLLNGQTGQIINQELAKVSSQKFRIESLSDGNQVLVTSGANSVQLLVFDPSTGEKIGSWLTLEGESTQFAATVNGDLVVLNCSTGATVPSNASLLLISGNTSETLWELSLPVNTCPSTTLLALDSGNLILSAPQQDLEETESAGYLAIIDSDNGELLASYAGEIQEQRLGNQIMLPLNNGNILVSTGTDASMTNHQGSLMLLDGESGNIITTFLDLQTPSANADLQVYPLSSDKFVIVAPNHSAQRGGLWLFDAVSASQIGTTYSGDHSKDRVGASYVFERALDKFDRPSLVQLDNDYFVLLMRHDHNGDPANAPGSAQVFDLHTGATVGDKITGLHHGDFEGAHITAFPAQKHFVIALPYADVDGIENAGKLIDVAY